MDDETTRIKILGQFNTEPAIIDYILKQSFIPTERNISILEPSSGEGNFVKGLNTRGYHNIKHYEIDPKYKNNGATIQDFLKADIPSKFDLIIGNPPFTSIKLSKSYYGNGDTEFKTRFIEMLFLEKCLPLLKDTGKLVFVFPNRLFLDTKFNAILKILYAKGFYINRIIDLPLNIFTNTKCTTSVLICISKQSSDIHANNYHIPIAEFLDDSNYYLHKDRAKFIDKNAISLGDLMDKIQPPEKSKNKPRITIGTLNKITSKTPNYLAIVRNGNSGVGNFTLYDPQKYYFNDCFYFYKIKNGYGPRIIQLLESIFYRDYIKLISNRTGARSLRNEDLLSLVVK